jgi:hypothetical protein
MRADLLHQHIEVEWLNRSLGRAGVAAREKEQVFDKTRHALGFFGNLDQRTAIGFRRAGTAQRQLGAGTNDGERSAQLMRSIGRELRQRSDGGFEPAQHGVPDFRQALQLIPRLRSSQPQGKVVDGDGLRG